MGLFNRKEKPKDVIEIDDEEADEGRLNQEKEGAKKPESKENREREKREKKFWDIVEAVNNSSIDELMAARKYGTPLGESKKAKTDKKLGEAPADSGEESVSLADDSSEETRPEGYDIKAETERRIAFKRGEAKKKMLRRIGFGALFAGATALSGGAAALPAFATSVAAASGAYLGESAVLGIRRKSESSRSNEEIADRTLLEEHDRKIAGELMQSSNQLLEVREQMAKGQEVEKSVLKEGREAFVSQFVEFLGESSNKALQEVRNNLVGVDKRWGYGQAAVGLATGILAGYGAAKIASGLVRRVAGEKLTVAADEAIQKAKEKIGREGVKIASDASGVFGQQILESGNRNAAELAQNAVELSVRNIVEHGGQFYHQVTETEMDKMREATFRIYGTLDGHLRGFVQLEGHEGWWHVSGEAVRERFEAAQAAAIDTAQGAARNAVLAEHTTRADAVLRKALAFTAFTFGTERVARWCAGLAESGRQRTVERGIKDVKKYIESLPDEAQSEGEDQEEFPGLRLQKIIDDTREKNQAAIEQQNELARSLSSSPDLEHQERVISDIIDIFNTVEQENLEAARQVGELRAKVADSPTLIEEADRFIPEAENFASECRRARGPYESRLREIRAAKAASSAAEAPVPPAPPAAEAPVPPAPPAAEAPVPPAPPAAEAPVPPAPPAAEAPVPPAPPAAEAPVPPAPPAAERILQEQGAVEGAATPEQKANELENGAYVVTETIPGVTLRNALIEDTEKKDVPAGTELRLDNQDFGYFVTWDNSLTDKEGIRYPGYFTLQKNDPMVGRLSKKGRRYERAEIRSGRAGSRCSRDGECPTT